MRFGNKTRNLAAAGRRFLGERTQGPAPVAPALVQEPDTTDHEEMVMTPPAPEESMVAGDPTQRLLTALGRFQRQVSRAEEGASQEAWCDECMNQLIAGIEIALNESWDDVQEALTDTARVLQTYEDAGRASDCVSFLKDSYEILCLMVGDLIVGNIRSGVMKKWRDRYTRALNDLDNLGLTLVDDGATLEREDHSDGMDDIENHGVDTPDPFTADFGKSSTTEDAFEDGEAFDALISPSDADGAYPAMAVPEKAIDPFDAAPADDSPFGGSFSQNSAAATPALPSLDALLHDDDGEEADLTLSNDFTAEDSDDEDQDYHGHRGENGFAAPEESDDNFFASHGSTDDRDDDVADDEDGEHEEEAVAEPSIVADAESLAPEPAAPPVVEAVAPPVVIAEPEPEPGSPQALWKTAQQAMALGNVSDAKLFALQLAVNMAQLEVGQAEVRMAEVEARIGSTTEEVAQAEQKARDAEERVHALEEQIAQCQKDFEDKRNHVQQLRNDVSAAEDSVAELDRQLAELEARRTEEQGRLTECQTVLDDSLSEESRMQAELDGLNEEEGGARENLDSVQQRVLDLKNTGTSHEVELKSAQEELEARRRAVIDIETTIGHVSGKPAVVEVTAPDAPATEENGDENAEGTESHAE